MYAWFHILFKKEAKIPFFINWFLNNLFLGCYFKTQIITLYRKLNSMFFLQYLAVFSLFYITPIIEYYIKLTSPPSLSKLIWKIHQGKP